MFATRCRLSKQHVIATRASGPWSAAVTAVQPAASGCDFAPDSRTNPPYLAGTTTTISRSNQVTPRSRVSLPGPPTEAALLPLEQRNAVLPQPSSYPRSYQAVSVQVIEEHLRTSWNEGPDSSSMRDPEPRSIRYSLLPDIPELEGSPSPPSFSSTAATQVINTSINSWQGSSYATEQARILLPRYLPLSPRRTNGTQWFIYNFQPVGTPWTTVPAPSMAQRPVGLRN